MKLKKKHIKLLLLFIILRCLPIIILIWWIPISRQDIPFYDGIWANSDKSFILDTDNFNVTITEDDKSETLFLGIYSGGGYEMLYDRYENGELVQCDLIHSGVIYPIELFATDYIHVKCDDGCFNTILKKCNTL